MIMKELTSRQIRIAELMVQGLQGKEIAKELGITKGQLDQEKWKAYVYAGVTSGPQYVYKLLKEGLIK